MYIDKLYNRLYSDNNKQGLNTLMNEIKLFSENEESAWDAFKNACKHGTRFIGKALKGLLIAGAPLAAAVAYLESSSNGRLFLKEHGIDYNQLKTEVIGPTEKAAKDAVNDNLELAGRKVKETAQPVVDGVNSFINGLTN